MISWLMIVHGRRRQVYVFIVCEIKKIIRECCSAGSEMELYMKTDTNITVLFLMAQETLIQLANVGLVTYIV